MFKIARGRLEGIHEDKKAFPVVRSDDDGMLSEPHFLKPAYAVRTFSGIDYVKLPPTPSDVGQVGR